MSSYFNFSRIVGAVYELVGSKGDNGKARELFNRMDKNRDGFVSQEKFMEVIRGENLRELSQPQERFAPK